MAFVSSVAVRPSLQSPALQRTSLSGARVAHASAPRRAAVRMGMVLPIFTQAMEDFKKDYPAFADRGWGATVKAERWNGRHAMFGFLVLVATGYCKGHGLIPDASVPLPGDWGVLGQLGDASAISMQRAIILVAHIHVLSVSVAAAIAPFSFQDKLLLEPGEADEEPAGLFPEFKGGLTKEAELWNCRVAMLGIICLVAASVATHTSILDMLNLSLGNLLF